MTDSPRIQLPLLAAGQAQKEITHNEALLRVDGLSHPVLESRFLTTPPATPLSGQLWLVPAAATGAWATQIGMLALWTDGGWRFVTVPAGFLAWARLELMFVWYDGTFWHNGDWPVASISIAGKTVVQAQAAAIAAPAAGTTIDSQARTTIGLVLTALRGHGLIAP